MKPCRLPVFFLCMFFLTSLNAQDSLLYSRITIPSNKYSIESAIRIIERQSGLSFSYNSDLISKKKEIVLAANNEYLVDVVKRVFNDPSLHFGIIGRHLVIYRPYKTLSANPEKPVDSVYYFIIEGQVLDDNTNLPLAFSSIYLVGKSIGTVSNEDGKFLLKLSSSELYEKVSISCIGYKNYTAPVSTLVNTSQKYYLETDIVPIQEVVIRRISPVLLLQDAIDNIHNNYPQIPALLTSFYREIIKRGNKYSVVSEAILENYKTGYSNTASDKIKILKGRKNENFQKNDSIMLKLKAGLNSMLLLDVVKNIPDFLTGDYTNEYRYTLADIVNEDGRECYAIDFTPKEGSSFETIYSGRILIDIHDLAFKWVEFYVNPAQLTAATSNFIVKKPPHIIVKALKAHYKVSFRKSENKYFLHLIQCETGFKIRNRRELSGTNYFTKIEMVVLGIDTVNVNKFTQKETAKINEYFTDQVGIYDQSFWGEYNFITPEESLENALSKIKKARDSEKNDE